MKTIDIDLNNETSLKNAIKMLEAYRDSLELRCEQCVERLAKRGLKVANAKLKNAQGDDRGSCTLYLELEDVSGAKAKANIIFTSEPNVDKRGRTFYPHLAFEFGAGIYWNGATSNPRAHEFGMGIGTFPGQTHALENTWYYRDEQGNLHQSHGAEATMPMYSAWVEMIENAEQVVKGVFW